MDKLGRAYGYGIGGLSGRTNKYGNFIERTDANGRTTFVDRDQANRITKITFPDGGCLEADYDDRGKAIKAVRMAVDQCALAPAECEPSKLQMTEKTHESRFNKPKVVTDTQGQTTPFVTYPYKALDLLETETDVRCKLAKRFAMTDDMTV